MKSVVLMIFLTMSSAFSQAAVLNLKTLPSLVAISDGKIRIEIKHDGTIVLHSYRIKSLPLIITNVKDSRPVDGNLEISLSNGSKLVQTSGFSPDNMQRIYFIDSAGKEVEMMPEAFLSVM
ncbi:MAG: hypothetical protein ACXWRE_00370 [Pseudobdellovibrionaceae bacterium]